MHYIVVTSGRDGWKVKTRVAEGLWVARRGGCRLPAFILLRLKC